MDPVTAPPAAVGAPERLDWLSWYSAPWDWVLSQPPWLGYLIIGMLLMYKLGAAGFVVAKAGRWPLWALALLVPGVELIAIWVFAYVRWPSVDNADRARGAPVP